MHLQQTQESNVEIDQGPSIAINNDNLFKLLLYTQDFDEGEVGY